MFSYYQKILGFLSFPPLQKPPVTFGSMLRVSGHTLSTIEYPNYFFSRPSLLPRCKGFVLGSIGVLNIVIHAKQLAYRNF